MVNDEFMPTDIQFKNQLRKELYDYNLLVKFLKNESISDSEKVEKVLEWFENQIDIAEKTLQD